MIIDYNFNKFKNQLSISYTKENGGKSINKYNVSRFKAYQKSQTGQFMDWDGGRCDEVWVEKPCRFNILQFIKELPQYDRDKILSKFSPNHYAWDIEVECGTEFPDPQEAKYPVLTISIVNPKMDCVVLGTKKCEDPENILQKSYEEYLNTSEFYRVRNFSPKIKYIYFETEEKMLVYFLKNIVAKAPVMIGWNSFHFDWFYIVTRLKNTYPEVSINMSSIDYSTTRDKHKDFRNNKYELTVPCHTLLVDLMDIIEGEYVVMPQKESMALDYIASECPVQLHKIEYTGNLQKLYEENYPKYVFYNAIDSALVQLIDMAFGTLSNYEAQAQYCECNIKAAFSRIKLSDTLFFNYFYDKGIRISPTERFEGDSDILWGAYVRQPTPGKHKYVCCNDFSSLYPSTIITCNLSIENYLGNMNKGDFTQEEINNLKKNPDYFVSVNGSVYKNDKDYAFRDIQKNLKLERGKSKYLSKQLDATVMSDIEHLLNNKPIPNAQYKQNIIDSLSSLGYDIKETNDIKKYDIKLLKTDLSDEIRHLSTLEQAIKNLMNSMYGGTSHPAFYFYNMDLANDITGESRNLIHLMESHIPEWFQKNWKNSKELHKLLGIELNDYIDPKIPMVELVYGDTDSLYICYEGLISTIKGSQGWTKSEIAHFIVDLNEKFLNDHNKEFMENYYKSRFAKSIHEFELETVNYSGVWLDVKKRYAQMLLWKDGKYYDEDNLPLKFKGLEIVKSSYPKFARNIMKGIVKTLLEDDGNLLIHKMNQQMQEGKAKYFAADLDEITPSSSINGYTKYVMDDSSVPDLKFNKQTPALVKGLALYNALRQQYNLPGDPDYGGKHRWYIIKGASKRKKGDEEPRFCYQPSALPKWAEQYAPVDRESMFNKMVVDPINRILVPCGLPALSLTGEIQFDLFG